MGCESILIAGTGALACYFAARLAPHQSNAAGNLAARSGGAK